jgi:hypothetical protein
MPPKTCVVVVVIRKPRRELNTVGAKLTQQTKSRPNKLYNGKTKNRVPKQLMRELSNTLWPGLVVGRSVWPAQLLKASSGHGPSRDIGLLSVQWPLRLVYFMKFG